MNKDTFIYRWLVAKVQEASVRHNPVNEMRRTYFKINHSYPDLENPRNLIEKIFWLQLNTDTSLWTRCADKYAMREYVKECGLELFLPLNLGHWNNVDEIDFTSLPNEFVLKTNNGCGTVLIVRDKEDLDIRYTKHVLRQWLKIPFGWSGAQLHYTRIKPCIIAEELLKQDEVQRSFSPESMVDYKVWCINGAPESVLIVYGRNRTGYGLDLYDLKWNRMSDKLNKNGHFIFHNEAIPKPMCLNEMIDISKVIAKPFPEVRVDFYVVNNKPIIGELTFTTGFGYFTDEYYEYLGSKIQLPEINKVASY